MIEFAQQHHHQSNLDFQVIDVSQGLTFQQEFDLIFSNSVIAWIPNFGDIVITLANALKPGGRLAIQAAYKERWLPEFYDIVESALLNHPQYSEIFQSYQSPCLLLEEPEDYCQLIEPAGFTAHHVEPIIAKHEFSPEEAYQQFESGILNAYLDPKLYTEETSTDYFEFLKRTLMEKLIQKAQHNKVTLHNHRLYLVFEKK